MQCIILGCGSSNGVPQIGCSCKICTSNDIRNHRLRSSILVESSISRILVDTSPDLRQQALANKIGYVDAILYTHDHADHISGIDDTRFLSKEGLPIPAYMDHITFKSLEKRFYYIFHQVSKLYKPCLEAKIFTDKFKIGDIEVIAFRQIHGGINSYGFRFGELAYSTDFNKLPEESYKVLQGVKIWVVDCLRYYWAPTHSWLEKTFECIARVQPEKAILTHMAHDMDYNTLVNMLPSNILPAYDGMKIKF